MRPIVMWLLIAAGVLASAVIVMLGVGSRLPREHVATVRTRFTAPPESLWALIADPARATSWRKDVKRVTMLPLQDGRVSWEEEGGFGTIRYVTAESDPPRRLVTRIISEGLPYGGQWEQELKREGPSTVLTTTERGFVNPALFRFLTHYVFGYTATMQTIHRALGAKLGESASPEVVASGR